MLRVLFTALAVLALTSSTLTPKTIYKINLNGATDVSGMASLPAGALPAGVTPVSKEFILSTRTSQEIPS